MQSSSSSFRTTTITIGMDEERKERESDKQTSMFGREKKSHKKYPAQLNEATKTTL